VAIRITLRIRESKVRNPDPPDRRRFVLSEHSFLVCYSFYPPRSDALFSSYFEDLLLLGFFSSVPILVKIGQEMRPRECAQTTDRQTHRRIPVL